MECKMEHGGRIHLSFQIFHLQITEWVSIKFYVGQGRGIVNRANNVSLANT
jgi:hypothetical protein